MEEIIANLHQSSSAAVDPRSSACAVPAPEIVRAIDRSALVHMQETSDKWERRRAEVRKQLSLHDTSVLPGEDIIGTLDFLYPSIASRAHSFLRSSEIAE